MTVEEYTAARAALGDRVEKVGRVYWTRSRKNFFRPLLPYEAYAPGETELPRALCSGFQYVVADEREANSTTSFLMLDDLRGYALWQLSHNRRRLINAAAKKMEIRVVRNLGELQDQGFAAYSSFYSRTGYQYMSARRRKAVFCQWAATLLQQPKTLILGAYDCSGLTSISISYLVDATLLYATFFSQTKAMQQGAGELMFHTLREAAGRTPGIEQIFVRRYQDGNGMDNYYLMRGAKLVRKPSKLQLSPVISWVLKYCLNRQYAILHGTAGPGT